MLRHVYVAQLLAQNKYLSARNKFMFMHLRKQEI